MSDALLILGMLTALVAVFVFLWWDIGITRRKANRWIHVQRIRQERQAEDIAYATWQLDVQTRAADIQAVFDRQPLEAVERLHALMQERPRLEVVG